MAHFERLNVLVDNGVYEIYIGSDGKLHIRWILPDPPPELFSELKAVSAILNHAAQLKDRAVAAKFQGFAEEVLNNRAKEITGILAGAGKEAAVAH
jgi:hypothetical protein